MSPAWLDVVGEIVCERSGIAAVGVDSGDLVVAVAHGRNGNPRAVRRPGGARLAPAPLPDPVGATAVRSRDDDGHERAVRIPPLKRERPAAGGPDRRALPEACPGDDPGFSGLDVDELDEVRERRAAACADEREPVAGGRPGETVEAAPRKEKQLPSTGSVGVDD